MIDEIIYCSQSTVTQVPINADPTSSVRDAGIYILNSNQGRPPVDRFTPVLFLTFDDYIPFALIKGHPLAKDKNLRKEAERKVKSGDIKLPNDRIAQKILLFVDELERTEDKYRLWLVCRNGTTRSASIARFLTSVNGLSTKTSRGLNCPNTDGHNIFLSGLLAHNYSLILMERVQHERRNSGHSEESLRG